MGKRGEFRGELEVERHRYVAMCRIVEAADKILAIHHGACFSCDIANMCLLLYTIAYYNTQSPVAAFIIWFLLFLGDIAIMCSCGILVNYGVSNTYNLQNKHVFSLKISLILSHLLCY